MNKQKGINLIEVMLSIGIASIIMLAGSEMLNKKSDDITSQGAALYQAMINNAAKRYIQANFSALQSSATPTSPVKVNFSQLSAAGYIPTNYSTSSLNPYGQASCVLILQPTSNSIRALVVTEGGADIPAYRLSYIARQIGLSGGYIDSSAPSLAVGSYGGWSESITNYTTLNCSGTPATSNHLASLLVVDNAKLLQDYLYRSAVPGHTEANLMSTPLLMGAVKIPGADCTSVGAGALAQDGTGAIISCKGIPLLWSQLTTSPVYWKEPVANIAALNAIACGASNSGEAHIIATPTVGTTARAYMCNSASWIPLGVDDNGNFTGNSFEAARFKVTKTAVELSTCLSSEYGNFAQDSQLGTLLTCQNILSSYQWKKPGNTYWRNSIPTANSFQNFYGDTNKKIYPAGTVVSEATGNSFPKMYMTIDGPIINGNNFIALAKGPSLNETTDRMNQVNENICTGNGCVATATCSFGSSLYSGFCSGTPVDVGVANGTTGWSCTSKTITNAGVRTLAFCK